MDDIIPEKFSFSAPPVSRINDVENLGLRRTYQPHFRTSQDSDDELSDTSVTCSTDSNASEYYLVTDTNATPAASLSCLSTSGNLTDDRPISQRSPSYTDKLRARASPPSLYTNQRDPEASTKNQDITMVSHLGIEAHTVSSQIENTTSTYAILALHEGDPRTR
jgi:hypothetical protein